MSIDQYSATPASNDLVNYFQTGMKPSQVKNAGWDVMADMKSYLVALPTAGGTANALTVANGRPFAALAAGLMQILNPTLANTGPASFAPDGLAAKSIFANGTALAGGEMQANVPAWLKYDGTQWNLLNPALPGRNFFVDPCCRMAQGDGTTSLSTTYQYGLVDLVQCKATGTAVSAGKITQDTAGTVAAATTYSCKLQGATITGAGKVFFRRWIESRDAVGLKNKAALFSVVGYQDTGSSVNAFLTVNKANSQDNFSTVTNIVTGAAVSLATATATAIGVATAMGDCSNGIEIILEMDCGAVTARNFYATDWQACISTLPQACVVPRFEDDFTGVCRYYETSYNPGVAPGTASGNGVLCFRVPAGVSTATTFGYTVQYKVKKLSNVSVTFYSTDGTSGVVNDQTAGSNKTASSFNSGVQGTEVVNSSGSTITAGDIIRFHYTADSRL